MKTITCLLVLCVLNISINAQVLQYSFYDYIKEYYNPSDTAEGGVSNELKRINMIWSPRLAPHGNVGIAADAYVKYVDDFNKNGKFKSLSSLNPNWICLGPTGSNGTINDNAEVGRMNRICFDPQYNGTTNQTLYAASSFGGLWRSENDGYDWASVNTDIQIPTVAIGDVVVSYQNSNHIFIATGMSDYGIAYWTGNKSNVNPLFTAGIYRSTDYGTTWEAINDGFLTHFTGGGTCRKMIINPTNENQVYIATSRGIFKTDNAMSISPAPTWYLKFEGIPAVDDEFRGLEFKPDDYNTVYASGKDIYRSIDGGSNWTSITGTGTGLDLSSFPDNFRLYRINIAVTPAASNNVFAYIVGDEEYLDGIIKRRKRIYLYKCVANTWSLLLTMNDATPDGNQYTNNQDLFNTFANTLMAIAVSPTNANEILFGHTRVRRSNNGGTTFYYASPYNYGGFHADVSDLKYPPINTNKIFCANDGGISVKDLSNLNDGGWDMRSRGLQVAELWTFDDSENDNTKLAIGEQDVGTRVQNTNNTWTKIGGSDGYGVNLESYYQELIFLNSGGSFGRINYNNTGYFGFSNNTLPKLPPNYTEMSNITGSFKVFNHPFNFSTYYTFMGEIYKQIKYLATSTDTWQSIWELSSDTYKIPDLLFGNPLYGYSLASWQRQHMEFAISESNPDVAYSVAYGLYNLTTLDNFQLPSHFYKTTTGFNANDISLDKWQKVTYPGDPVAASDMFPVITGIVVHPNDPNKIWVSFTGFYPEYKVWYSIDGGTTWTNADPSGSLANLPVNGIVYQKNTDDRLYIATDAGVYYKDASMTNWEKFGEFSNVRVMELKINYCSGKIRAATFGRGIWEGDILPRTNDNNEKIISEDITWDGNAWAECNIRVLPYKTLTITGTLNMAPQSKIIIERGGKLIVDAGKITNNCNNMWQGIEVQGNKTLRQYPETNQGVVEIINGGTIENALQAIQTIKTNTNGSFDWNYTGGIVKANGAKFINNREGIYIFSYHNHLLNGLLTSNISYIQNCTFETNAELNFYYLTPLEFIKLYDVEGINITANTFKNTNPNATTLIKKGNGILVYNSSCAIYGLCISNMIPCNTYQPNTFQGLNYAIWVSNSNSFKSVSISNNEFTNNYRGIALKYANNSVITSNTFDIPNILTTDPQGSYGMYVESCSGYKIEGNEFATTHSGKYGVAFKTFTNQVANTLYHNQFNNLDIGVLTANSFPPPLLSKAIGPPPPTVIIPGLQIKCNKFTGTYNKDIAITSGQIGSPQGNCISVTSPANNMFSFNGTNPDKDIFVNPGAGSFGYCHSTDALTTPIDFTTNKIGLSPCSTFPVFNEANSCPSTLGNIYNPNTNIAKIASLNNQIIPLVSLIDSGNSQVLLNKVNSNLSSGQLKDDLLNAGPYLSDNILIATVNRVNPVPPGILKDIIEPNSPLTTEVMNVVNSKNLPAGIMHDINSYQTGTSQRAILEQQINELQAEKDNKVAELMQYYLNDTSAYKIDSVIIFLETQTDLQSKKQLVTAYLINENCLLAGNVLDSLPQLTEEDIVFKEFYSIMVDLCSQSKTVYDLTPAQEQTMYLIVTTNTTTATAAKSVLTLVYGEYYPEIIEGLYEQGEAGIKGNLYESFECGGNPVSNTKLYLFDQNNIKIASVSPAIADNSGFFWFNNYYLSLLDSTALYSINTDGGYKIDNPEFKTINDWFNSSPLSLNLSKSNKEWSDFYSSVDSLYNGGNAVDLDGNIYVAGYTGTLNSLSDFLTIKYSPTGQQLWIKTYNGTGNGDDRAIDIAVDKDNNCYVLGNSAGNGTGQDIVLIKYDSEGNQIWLNRYNDSQNLDNMPVALTIDSTGNIYIAGYTRTSALTSNILALKYTKTGSVSWVKTYNVNPDNIASDIKVDYSGNIIVTGSTGTSTNMNFITLKYNKNGSVIWTKLYDSGANENMKALSVDNNNNIYVTGTGNYITTIKYNSEGTQQWLAIAGGTSSDIITDNLGNCYITGTNSTNGITVKYNSVGQELWNQTYSSVYYNGMDIFQAITLDKNNDVYVTGLSASAPNITKSYEMVTIKYNTDGNEIWIEKLNGNPSLQAAGNDIVVSENLNVYVTGRVYDDYIYKMSTVKYSQCAESSMLKSMESQTENENQVISENINLNNKAPWILAMPNPINESSVIAVNTASENDCVVEITDLFGRTVKSINIKGSCKEVQIPRNELSVGIYNISLKQNGKKIAFSRMAVVE